jgi:hypothetical protein
MREHIGGFKGVHCPQDVKKLKQATLSLQQMLLRPRGQ